MIFLSHQINRYFQFNETEIYIYFEIKTGQGIYFIGITVKSII